MAKKVNKVVVGAVSGVIVLAGGTYLASHQIVRLLRPTSKLLAEADANLAKGDYEGVVLNLGKVINREGATPEIQLKYLDALDYTVKGDYKRYSDLRQQQAALLANDPRSVPVLRRVYAFQKNDVDSNPADNPSVRNLAATSQRLLQLVPNDRDARVGLMLTVLDPLQRNLEVKPEDVDKQRDEADKLFEEKPDDGDAIRIAAGFRRAALFRALQGGGATDIQTKAKANVAFIDAAVAKAPNNPQAWAARSDIYRDAVSILGGKDDTQREAYAKESYDSLLKASALIKADDPYFISIRSTALKQMELGDPKSADAGYRKLLTEAPDDRQPRIMLADFLARQPGRRDEAVAVLDKPFTLSKPLHALDSLSQKYLSMLEQVRKTSIRVGALAAVTDPTELKVRTEMAEKEYRALTSDADIAARFKPAILRIQGGLQAAQGQLVEAINTLDSARKMLDPNSTNPIEADTRNDVLQEYAQVELRLNQPGEAMPALLELVQRQRENFGARLILTDMLIRDHNVDGAEQQMVFLERFLGTLPDVKRMRLMIDSQKGSTLADHYKGLSEKTRDERFLKLQAAGTLNNADEVERLAKLILADNPADFGGVTSVVPLLVATGKRDDAVSVINAAIAAKPDEPRFKTILENLNAGTPDEQQQLTQSRIDAIQDPYIKKLAQGDLFRTQGKPNDAIAAYKAAAALRPDDVRAPEAEFQTALIARQFADAEALLPTLSKLNVDQAGGALRRIQLAGARAAVEPDADKRAKMFSDVAGQAQKVATDYHELGTATQLYATVLMQTGDYNAAVEQFGQTLDKNSSNLEALIGITDALMRADRRTEANDRLTQARALAPNDSRVAELQTAYELRYGDPTRAVDALQKEADANPDSVVAVSRLAVALDQASIGRPTQDEKTKFLTRAATVYQDGFAKFPQDLRFLVGYMDVSHRLGKPEDAIAAVEKLAAQPADHARPEVVSLLAQEYVRSNRLDDAVRVLSEAVHAVSPPPIDLLQQLALIQGRQNKLADALSTLSLRPDDPNVQRQRVAMMIDAGDVNGAQTAVDSVLASNPGDDTYLLAAFVRLRAGDFAKAEEMANKVIADRPADATAYYYRAQARLNHRPPDLDAIRDDLVKSRDLAPGNADVRTTLSDVFRVRGDTDAALAELQAAWGLNHSNKLVLTKLVNALTTAQPPAWSAAGKAIDEAKTIPQLAADPDVLLLEADTYVRRNDTPKAVSTAAAALALAPDNFALQQRYFDVLLRVKDFQDVLDQSANALDPARPNAWWFYHLRAVALMGQNKKDEAAKLLDQAFQLATGTTDVQAISMVASTIDENSGAKAAAAKLDPYADPALQALAGELLQGEGDNAEAIAKLQPLAADADKLPAALRVRVLKSIGIAYLQSEPVQTKNARATFEALLKYTPDDVAVLNNLACVLLLPDSGAAPADALKPAQHAMEVIGGADPGTLGPVIWDTYGYALVKAGKTADGLTQLQHSAETATFPDVFLHLAETYLASNNVDSAESALADAKSRLATADRRKQRVDPALREKFAQLTADLAKRKPAAG